MKKAEIIARLKEVAVTKLEKRVLSNILSNTENYNGTFQEKLETLFSDYSHGCSTGIVTELIYYHDTTRFFNRYRSEIIELFNEYLFNGCLQEVENINGETVVYLGDIEFKVYNNELNQIKFDKYQKNILAWFAFEECTYKFRNILEEITF